MDQQQQSDWALTQDSDNTAPSSQSFQYYQNQWAAAASMALNAMHHVNEDPTSVTANFVDLEPPAMHFGYDEQMMTENYHGMPTTEDCVPSSAKLRDAHVLTAFLNYHNERRKSVVRQHIAVILDVVGTLMRDVESQEPRFVCQLNSSSVTDAAGFTVPRIDQLRCKKVGFYQVILPLNQMGVFNFVEEATLPGCASLKLSDGRKRSMSLWVEFITASGYLSARKLRSRLQALLHHAIGRCGLEERVHTDPKSNKADLLIDGHISVTVIPSFHCSGLWPRIASHWPHPQAMWPSASAVAEAKAIGFSLISKESPSNAGNASSSNNTAQHQQNFANSTLTQHNLETNGEHNIDGGAKMGWFHG